MGPAETLSAAGMNFLLDLGEEISDEFGDRLAPVGLVLETYFRNPRLQASLGVRQEERLDEDGSDRERECSVARSAPLTITSSLPIAAFADGPSIPIAVITSQRTRLSGSRSAAIRVDTWYFATSPNDPIWRAARDRSVASGLWRSCTP